MKVNKSDNINVKNRYKEKVTNDVLVPVVELMKSLSSSLILIRFLQCRAHVVT